MGTCHEFGPSIQEGCNHPMQATHPDACTCAVCGVVCHGRFAGCATVWARGPQEIQWKPVAGPPPTGRAAEGDHAGDAAAIAAVVTAAGPVHDDLATAVRRLTDEVERLRDELDDQRLAVGELSETLPALVSSAVREEFQRALPHDAPADLPFHAAPPPEPDPPGDGVTSALPAEPRPTSLWQDRTA